MIHFAWLWAFAFLPLPLVVRWLLPPHHAVEQAALRVPFLNDLTALQTETKFSAKSSALYLAAVVWALLVLSCAKPQWLGEPIEQAVSGRDLMLAVDLSRSMEAQDFKLNKRAVDRLTAIKFIANEFIGRRVGDRIGLILFGSQAYLQVPLTFDRKTVQILLNEAALGLAGENTAIGDAIGLAVKRLKNQTANSHVLILLTDGANTAGEVSPLKAAELAKNNGLKIYTIGIGADEMEVSSLFGSRKVNPSLDLDENTLVKIAELTGGFYYRARNTQELDGIYKRLDELEPVEKDKQYFRPRTELYAYPLTAALFLIAVLCAVKLKRS